MRQGSLLCLIVFLAPVLSDELPSNVQGVMVAKDVQSSFRALIVSWSAVSGSNVTYTVCYSTTSGTQSDPPSGANCGTSGITGTSITLGSLSEGTTYYIWVRAESSGAQGPYSDRVHRNTCNVPSRPTLAGVYHQIYLPFEVGITVSWKAPQSDCDITSYEVQYKISSNISWSIPPVSKSSRSRRHNWKKLSTNTSYNVQVRAVSAAGKGAWSDVGHVTTPGVPGPVRTLSATPIAVNGVPALHVRWSPPVDKAGGGLTYRLRVVPPNVIESRLTATEHEVKNLRANTNYTVYVSAGSLGPYGSEVSIVTTTVGTPGPVRSLSATPTAVNGAPALHVRWSPPVDKAGGGLTYRLRVVPHHVTISRPIGATVYIMTGLRAKTRYTVYVSARSLGVYGTEVSAVNTTVGIPGPVRSFSATPIAIDGVPALHVSWSPPVDKAGGGLTYRLRVVPPHVTISSPVTATVYNVTGLRANTSYTLYVSARSSGVYGPQKSAVGITGGRPNSFTVTQLIGQQLSTSSVTLRISPSVGSRYVVFYREDGQQFTKHPTTFSSANNVVITGLQSNTGYTMRVQASNNYGSTNSSDVDVYTLPGGPTDLILSPLSSTSVLCSWTPPVNHRKTPLMYAVSHGQAGAVSTAETSLTLTGLQPYKEYTISVKAQNRRGSSVPVTGTVRTYSDTPSGRPQRITSSVKGTSWIEITWTIPPAGGRNGIITNYIIDLSSRANMITVDVQTPNFSSPENLYYNITGLSAGSEYTVRVAASTVNGTGPFTGEVRIRTLDDVPGPVRNLTFEVIPQSEGSVRISWVAPAVTNGDIESYEVTYGVLDGTDMKLTVSNPPVVLTNLTGQTPYRVGVRAGTSKGVGEATSIVVFSSEGVPENSVSNLTAFWKDGVVEISWIPLSLFEAKGFPLYTISYTLDNGTMRIINTTNSSIVISGLEPKQSYTFTVQVTTGNGTNKDQIANVNLRLATPDDPVTGGDSSTVLVTAAAAIPTVLIIAVVIVAIVIIVCVRRRKVSESTALKTKSDKNEYPLQPIGIADMSVDAGSIADVPEDVLGTDGRIIPRARFTDTTNFLHLGRDHGFEEEFKTIINDPDGSDVIAKANRHKNRYGNIYTYDHSRVVLNVPDSNGNDYINASFIDGYRRQNAYIAAQGPTPATISDFWQMIWDQKCPVIVMLTNIEENGKRKCEQYWNEDMDHPLEPGRDLCVRVTSLMGYANYVIREIALTNMSSTHSKPLKVKHFHFTTWPDFGVPTHPSSLVKFVQQVRKEYKDSTAPMLVHCSAGVGRTGTFITIDAMMERLKEKDDLNIHQFVTEMRSKRTFMVQTMDQYAFIHDALCDYLTCGDTSIPAHQLRGEIGDMDKVDNDTTMSGFESQFKLLDSVSKKPASADETFAKKSVVEKKNRYKDRFPYSNSYLHISGKGTTSGSDYVNASFVDSYKRKKAFIAAQAPLESTRNDVWEMIWQMRPSTIVLLSDFKEGKEITCLRFWPDEQTKAMDFGVLKVNHKDTTKKDTDYDVINLEVFDRRKESGRVRTITLFHLRNWYKNGRPPLEAILRLMGDVENAVISIPGDVPAMVMCDDGMGRSGVFICAMSEVERVKVEGQVDVFQTIKGMRIQRPHMVDTPDQYKLCFDILQSYLDSFDTYANFKTV